MHLKSLLIGSAAALAVCSWRDMDHMNIVPLDKGTPKRGEPTYIKANKVKIRAQRKARRIARITK